MKTLSRTKTIAAAALAAASFGLPTLASAGNYQTTSRAYADCRKADQDNQIVGGIIGAIAGGVAGSQVSGRGARTEGSVIGAVAGAAVGASIADGQRKCRSEVYTAQPVKYVDSRFDDRRGQRVRTVTTTQPYRVVHPTRTVTTSRHYDYSPPRYHNTTRYAPPRHYGTKQQRRLNRINAQLDDLRLERRRINRRLNRNYNPRLLRRLDAVNYEIRELRQRKRRIQNHRAYR